MPKPTASKPTIIVRYCPKDFLDGTKDLSLKAEIAYRRICDLIYDTQDQVRDDDARMAHFTKLTMAGWRAAKIELLIEGKLVQTEDGRLTNPRCQRELAKAKGRSEKARGSADERWGKDLSCSDDANASSQASPRASSLRATPPEPPEPSRKNLINQSITEPLPPPARGVNGTPHPDSEQPEAA